jgi:netrin receptor unc-5
MEDGAQMISESLEISRNTVNSFLGQDDYFCNCVAWSKTPELLESTVVSSNAKVLIASLGRDFEVEPYVGQKHLVGQNVEINCVPPVGKPTPKISWLKDDMPIEPENDPNIILNYEGNLIIKAARLRDSGTRYKL